MPENDLTLAAMPEALAKSTDYRVLRRLVRREAFGPPVSESTKTGILLDVETTGLDKKDEVIELGMVKFTLRATRFRLENDSISHLADAANDFRLDFFADFGAQKKPRGV